VKLPWHMTLLQVLATGSKVAPAAMTIGFWEKSTAKPVGEWHPAQVTPEEKAPPRRWLAWRAPAGATTAGAELEVLAPHPAMKEAMLETTRRRCRRGVRMSP
jgi:hypothetical protein